ncbi:MAG: hypothetical protein Q8Q04_02155 [archaeon]|nr:hypothetical protein [archaeon]
MGQLNKTPEDLPEELRTFGKENLQSCYSSEEIVSLSLKEKQ